MQGAQCPRCHENVRVPEAAETAVVRCPWCGEEYSLGECLRGLPPALILVSPLDSAGSSAAFQDVESYGFDDEDTDDAEEYQLKAHPSDPFPALMTTESVAVGAGTRSYPAVHGDRQQRRRRGGNPLLGALKIAAGGAVGIFLALVILQTIGRLPDLGFWPFRGPETAFWGGDDSGDRGRRRAMRPSGFDRSNPSEDARTDQPAIGRGRELDLPALPEFATNGPTDNAGDNTVGSENPSADSGLAGEAAPTALSPLESEIQDLQGILDQWRERDRAPAEQPVLTSDESAQLADQFIAKLKAIGAKVVAAQGIEAVDQVMLDAVLIGLSEEERFLREIIGKMTSPLLVGEEASEMTEGTTKGVLLVGRVEQQGETLGLKLPGANGSVVKVKAVGSSTELKAKAVVLAIGAATSDASDAETQVYYACQILGR